MQPATAPVSATDAIGLAFTHTRSVLGSRPFRAGRFFKLALLGAFTQATFLSVSITYPLQGVQLAFLSRARHAGRNAFASDGIGAVAGAVGWGLLLAALVVLLLFTLAYLYVICRARAALFNLVLTRGGRIRDAWRRHARPARRYFGLFLLAMLLFWTVMAAVLGPVLVRFVKVSVGNGQSFDATPQLGSLMLTLVGLVWLLLPIWIAVDALLQDFVLPGLALDQLAPVSAAFSRLGAVMRNAPGQLLLFLLLRTVVAFAVAMSLGLITLVALGLLALSGYGVGRVLYSLLWSGGLGGHAVFFAAISGMVLAVLALYWISIVAIFGVTGTFKTSYAAYFFAGYYPALASQLYGAAPADPSPIDAALPPPLPPELW